MVVRNDKQKKSLKNMEYLIKEGSRVAFFGKSHFKKEITTVDEINTRKDGSQSAALKVSPNLTVFVGLNKLRPIFVDQSIPNGVHLTDCCARPFTNKKANYMPDEAVGKAFKIKKAYLEGVMVYVDNEAWGNNYFLNHDTYHIVPNYKTAWVWKETRLVYEDVLFNNFTGKYVQWKSCKTGQLLKDRIVKNNITEGLDFGRKIMQNAPIEVVR